MNKKQQVIDRLAERSRNDIIRKLKADFVKEDTTEPFVNREYVDETIRLFDMLDIYSDEPERDFTDEAIRDIVNDIFRHFRGNE